MATESNNVASSNLDGKAGAKPEQDSTKGSCCLLADILPARYILSALFFVGIVSLSVTRSGFNFAIVVMVNRSSRVAPANQTDIYQLCPSSGSGNTSAQNQGELAWSESVRGILLGGYFYGYVITQIVGGVLEQKLGGKIVYASGLVLTAALNAVSPVAARTSPWAMFAVRFCMGLTSGMLFPTMFGVWGRWAPPTERTKLLAFCYIGLPVGNVINTPLASTLAADLGWPFVFYIPGCFVAVWLIAWVVMAYDSPAKHPRILEEEQNYIESSIGARKQKPKVPWLKVLTSLPTWALIVGQFSSNWGNYFLATQLPNYMQNMLGFSIRTNGLLSALPPACSMVSMLTSSFAADRLVQAGKIPKVWIRRGFVITGFSAMVISGVILANLRGCDRVAAVALLCCINAFNALTMAGFRTVHVEFAPRFSGVTFSLANTAGTLPGIFAPLLVGFITDNDPTVAAWTKIFYIGAAIQGVGGIFTVVFMRTDVQAWARGKDEEQPNVDDKTAELTGPTDLIIANKYAEMPTNIDVFSTKL